MLIRNNGKYHESIPGTNLSVRPYRTIEVPDGEYTLNDNLEIVTENKSKASSKAVSGDLDGDGDFDKDDKTIAGRVLSKKLRKKKGE